MQKNCDMERRRLNPIICSLAALLMTCAAFHQTAGAQEYVAPPVSISKDKVKIDGKVFYSHIVLEKQTLFSISKAYDVSIEDIYRYNPDIKENGLRKNDIINIPVNAFPPRSTPNSVWIPCGATGFRFCSGSAAHQNPRTAPPHSSLLLLPERGR